MRKFFVRLSFPGITAPGCANIQTSFILWDDTGHKAADRARHWGIAVVKDMLKHNKINPAIIELVAADMVEILSVKALEG